ncbi:hypothetical protein MJ863_11490 [Alcaligenes ammonioxydans]|uniref:type ISP restriction/modification enzyme n=1 Tax=Alcaligenes ammonioxydans TaxID=2582914 RepID=UPI001F06DCB0|nr:type ISP restriction/modification enzyme [Alcaligenes faecalis]MCH1880205.1 hypothetical protein [Alcaligenes ammonioxydans]
MQAWFAIWVRFHEANTRTPLETHDYAVNGKPALGCVIERQCVKTIKARGIVNDTNEWAIDTVSNPKYPLELFFRAIPSGLSKIKIVRSLPAALDNN